MKTGLEFLGKTSDFSEIGREDFLKLMEINCKARSSDPEWLKKQCDYRLGPRTQDMLTEIKKETNAEILQPEKFTTSQHVD